MEHESEGGADTEKRARNPKRDRKACRCAATDDFQQGGITHTALHVDSCGVWNSIWLVGRSVAWFDVSSSERLIHSFCCVVLT